MNKIEFQRRLEEVDSLIARGKYSDAVKKCDLMNLDLCDQPRRLQNIAKAYEKCRRYADAEDLLILAREHAPRSRSILYHLCSVATKAGEVEEAKTYYREFCEMTRNDPERFLLQYRIARADEEPAEKLAEILENYKREEPDDRWMLELAKLYVTVGDKEKAVAVLEDIDLWFDGGKYVSAARALHAELTGEIPSAKAEEEASEDVYTEGDYGENAPDVHTEEVIVSRPAEPEAAVEYTEEMLTELPEETLKEIALGAEDEDLKKERSGASSNPYGAPTAEPEMLSEEELKALAKNVSYYSVPSYKTPVTDVNYEEDNAPVSEEPAVDATPEKKSFAIPEYFAAEEIENAEEPAEEEKTPSEPKGMEDMTFTMDAGIFSVTSHEEKMSGAKEDLPAGASEEKEALLKAASAEEDGLLQVEIEIPDEDDYGEIPYKDPDVVKAEEEARKKAAEAADPQNWSYLTFDDENAEELFNEMPKETGEPAPVIMPEDFFSEEDAFDIPEIQPAFDETEETGDADPDAVSGEGNASAKAALEKSDEAKTPADDRVPSDKPDASANAGTLAESEETEDDILGGMNSFLLEMKERNNDSKLFGNLPVEPQVDETTWHFMVFGETNMLTTEAAREHMKEIAEENPSCPQRMLKISSEKIGGASIVNSLDRFLGNMVIVEQAGSLSDAQLMEFAKVLDRDDRSLLIAFTDSKDDMIEMFRRVPKLAESFTAVFEGKKFNAKDLVNTAKEYLFNEKARMTEEAEKLVYEKARRLLSEKTGFYKNSIREYAELALIKADRGFLGLGRGKCDREGYTIVDAKHFRKADKA